MNKSIKNKIKNFKHKLVSIDNFILKKKHFKKIAPLSNLCYFCVKGYYRKRKTRNLSTLTFDCVNLVPKNIFIFI